MIENQALVDRLIRYAKVDTQSAEDAPTQPSTQKQHDLALLLEKELRDLGVEARYDRAHCYVYATLPGEVPALGFVAHMDTSPAASGAGVSPRVEENYQGGDIVLKAAAADAPAIVLSPEAFPALKDHVGEDLVVTDGTTLLGADDKAGVAEIMELLAYYVAHPEEKHRTICVAFTPDEEVGRGTECFDLDAFGAKEAYTVDGGALGEIEYECFNAAAAKIEIIGRSVHPGSAKNLMINALNVAWEFHALLPKEQRPEHTEGYEGFFHLDAVEGDVEHAVLRYIVRDHDFATFEARKARLLKTAAFVNDAHRALAGGQDILTVSLRDQYYNMAIPMQKHMHLVARAEEAMRALGVTPDVRPIRGGTDGAALTAQGVPCPNLCTGGGNFHGRFEYASVQEMETVVKLLVRLAAAQ